ncbi:TetR/AcrR family transcriptional regulator [Halobacillus litoralis]|uniref:TetR/AcrR family transcriptional regulator n=1 Tax=Halobacillus litoralis TaxID=45668 RepID=UPI001CFDB28F|nr:TetR/AcrR family transcriptional regulator [Halobacillus litoralis]
MGRKRILSEDEIMKVTGEVLRQEGINGVHFKKLSAMLDVSRSTLYEYYKNKDDLILAYMKRMMDEMKRKVHSISMEEAPNHRLYLLLQILLEHAETYHIDQMIRELQTSEKNLAMFYRTELHKDLMETYDMMMNWIEEAKLQKVWKTDVSSELIGDMIFHSILFSNRKKLGVTSMAEQLFELIENGLANK